MQDLGASVSGVIEQGVAEPDIVSLVAPHSDASASRPESPDVRDSLVFSSREIPEEVKDELSWEACHTWLDMLPNQK